MSFYGIMRTSVSDMAAQATRLATGANNIANIDTDGFKRASTEFSSMVPETAAGRYGSGGLQTHIRNSIAEQGALERTTSSTDIAVNGDGFFVVSDTDGTPFLTRAGAFVPDGDGGLVNAAGFYLMGYDLQTGPLAPVANGYTGLEVVNIFNLALQANPSVAGTFQANLPSQALPIAAADLPSGNLANAQYTAKTSLVVYDNLGAEVILDVYSSKVANEDWEIAVFDRAAAGPNGGFPYAAGPLSTTNLLFDPANGQLTGASPLSISIAVPNGGTLDLDLSQFSQLAADYTVIEAFVDGNAPSGVDSIEIASDGVIYAVFENGARLAVYQIPLADVPSPDNLRILSGNVFAVAEGSGDVQIGFPGIAGLGTIVANALEQSTVDLADELTSVIEAQRGYTANSKVFQTGSELLEVLVNLKR